VTLTASRLRQDIYRILDQVIETGIPVEIERKGKIVRLVPADSSEKLGRLPKRKLFEGDPEDLVHVDWSESWRP
jgi:prevent-host-death family protein